MTDRNTHSTGRSLWGQRAEEVSDLRAVLERYRWHLDAACRDGSIDFFHEPGSSRNDLSSAAALLPLLLCQRCPVRPECLKEALTPWRYQHAVEDSVPVIVAASGTWGGTVDRDRLAVKKLPIEVAHASLEVGLEQRIALRIAAWRKAAAIRARQPQRFGGGNRASPFDKRIAAILAERDVKRFHLHKPGPGRGHKGPLAQLAAELGVSRSTAWRRLHTAA